MARRFLFWNCILPQSLMMQRQTRVPKPGRAEGGFMTVLKKTCLAAVIAAATVGIATAASAQYVDPDYGGYSARYYSAAPSYYDEDVVVVRRARAPAYYGYGYWTP